MVTLLAWLTGTGLMFLWFGALAASTMGMVRRSRFWTRVICVGAGALFAAAAVAEARTRALLPTHELGLPWLTLLVAALAAGPLVLFRRAPEDRGGGPPWEPPPGEPDPPGGERRLARPTHRSRRLLGPQPPRTALRRRGVCRPAPRRPVVRPCR